MEINSWGQRYATQCSINAMVEQENARLKVIQALFCARWIHTNPVQKTAVFFLKASPTIHAHFDAIAGTALGSL
ncbi:hypothetical protein [Gluconobacter cerinus]|uniref:hypothetical protein n=1 Tax=Gluconobacter cerinus TaxID=38307 RepID=UPI001B8CA241|nr:hypothetical protein [Gluconobacter cerinus]MBS1067174.1 hypothetical protein [Gluconobacter cerinus]